MTILEDAKNGYLDDKIKEIFQSEHISPLKLLKGISNGRIVLMKRKNEKLLGIGSGLRTKINVNLGTSSSLVDIEEEKEKVRIAEKYGADTISDLSMGGNIDNIREVILKNSSVPITTVPIYQSVIEADSLVNVSEDIIWRILEKQLKSGISSIVIHAGFNLEMLERMKGKRIMGMVSKGGSLTASIMSENNLENPFLRDFEYLSEMLRKYDVVLNLGNAMRSGCIHDKVDEFQFKEILMNNKLAKKANIFGIQVILESLGGHINVGSLMEWIKIHKQLTDNRPLFVSGPLPVDNAVGYDHIAAAIGGAFASGFGADYLCAITPAEHLCLPTIDDIKNGLITCKIASHVGDSLKFGLNHLFKDDLELSKYRFQKDWSGQFEHSLDPEEPKKRDIMEQGVCTMCGKHCALSISKKILSKKK